LKNSGCGGSVLSTGSAASQDNFTAIVNDTQIAPHVMHSIIITNVICNATIVMKWTELDTCDSACVADPSQSHLC